eukprot:m51a1_g9756 hypothetical protein (497) ;mRNA; r:1610756-1612246
MEELPPGARTAPSGAHVDLTQCLPDEIVARILAITSRNTRVSEVCVLTRVCRRWHRLLNRPPFEAWRETEFLWRRHSRAPSALVGLLDVLPDIDTLPAGLWRPRPPHIDPSLWGPHTLVFEKDRGFQAVELELVGLCRDSLRTLEGGHPEAAQAALATCPLLRSLDVSALDNCVVRGFVERARAGLPAIDELPGLNKVNDCELPPGDSPEGRMLAHALRSIKIEGALEKVLRSLVALGCQRLEHLSCWLCLVKWRSRSDELLRDARMLAEGLCPLRRLTTDLVEVTMLTAFAEDERQARSLRFLTWRNYRAVHWDDERSAAENAQFAAALARLTALERLVLEDKNHMRGALLALPSLRSLVSLATQWAEGMEAVLPQCTQLTFLHLLTAPCAPELLQSAVVPLAGLVHLELVGGIGAGNCTDNFIAELAYHSEWLPELREMGVKGVDPGVADDLSDFRPQVEVWDMATPQESEESEEDEGGTRGEASEQDSDSTSD